MDEVYNKIRELYNNTIDRYNERLKENKGFAWGSDPIIQRLIGNKNILEEVLSYFDKEQKDK